MKQNINNLVVEFMDSYNWSDFCTKSTEDKISKHLINLMEQVVQLHQAKIQELSMQLPPFNADPKNPTKHIYQNEAFFRGIQDALEVLSKRI